MRFLILNFCESPENYHLERTLASTLSKQKRIFYIIHNFKSSYLPLSSTPERNRFRFDKTPHIFPPFELIISIDFPWKRDKAYLFYLKLLERFKETKKIIIANHLCPDPGQSAFLDDAKRYGLLSFFNSLYILEYDDERLWPKGIKIKKRRFAIDTDYYRPIKTKKIYDIVLFGAKSREFSWVDEFAKKYSIAIITSINHKPTDGITFFKLEENLFNIRTIINQSRIMAIPIKEDEPNPACGNTAAFMAMACSVVPLVRDTPYMRGYIKEGKTGFLYRDREEFKSKLEALLKRDLREFAKATRDAALKNASLRKVVEEILSKEVR